MNKNKLKHTNFSFMWNGLVHLDDGSQWRLADPERRHDVTWWQNGETVDLVRHHGRLNLRNLSREEEVPIAPVTELTLELAA